MTKQLDFKTAKELLPKRKQDSHKNTYGKILNISGSKFYQGAAFLSSLSALKIGAGYVSLACPDCILDNIASIAPELTFIPLRSFQNESIASDNDSIVLERLESYDVISIGCGLSTNSSTVEFIGKLLQKIKTEKPIVLDADGLNAISILGLVELPQNCIITPHPKELSRLLEVSVEEINNNRIEYAKATSKKYNCITLLKGQNSVITDGKGVYINPTGCSGLAKAGSGDVLTGIITGLIAQKMEPFKATILGSYIHGLLADTAKNELTEYSILATDLISYIPKVLQILLK